jgi:hypothetical protein
LRHAPSLGEHEHILKPRTVLRAAGGRASEDALRSIAISQRLLGTKEVFIVHHTDCGMLTFHNHDIREKIKTDLGEEAYEAAKDKEFLPFQGELHVHLTLRSQKSIHCSNLVSEGAAGLCVCVYIAARPWPPSETGPLMAHVTLNVGQQTAACLQVAWPLQAIGADEPCVIHTLPVHLCEYMTL